VDNIGEVAQPVKTIYPFQGILMIYNQVLSLFGKISQSYKNIFGRKELLGVVAIFVHRAEMLLFTPSNNIFKLKDNISRERTIHPRSQRLRGFLAKFI